jgi:hypothetical protein
MLARSSRAVDVQARALPQQEPGPAQPEKPGDDPQQPVSFAPGRFVAALPVRLLVGDISCSAASPPQEGHLSPAPGPSVMTSPEKPQSRQMISWIGMAIPSHG